MKRVSLAVVVGLGLVACNAPRKFTANIEVVGVEAYKDESGTPRMYALELKYADCPGDARRYIRADQTFTKCAAALPPGAHATADLVSTWSADRAMYRSEITRLGDCPLKQDPKDEANYETVQTCSDVKASGFTVGVRCDRKRNKELTDKCPWLGR